MRIWKVRFNYILVEDDKEEVKSEKKIDRGLDSEDEDSKSSVIPNPHSTPPSSPHSPSSPTSFIKSLLLSLISTTVTSIEERAELMLVLEQRKKKWLQGREIKLGRATWKVERKEVCVREELERVFEEFQEV
jgi:hypothetical protein